VNTKKKSAKPQKAPAKAKAKIVTKAKVKPGAAKKSPKLAKKAPSPKVKMLPAKSRRHEAERPNQKSSPVPKIKAPPPQPKTAKTKTVTAKTAPTEKIKLSAKPAEPKKSANILHAAASAARSGKTITKPGAIPAVAPVPAAVRSTSHKSKNPRTTLDDLALDIDEKDDLLEEEKRDLIQALREEEDEPLETAFVPTDTSERFILVVDEEGQRRNETVTIVSQILPNAVVEVADDPEEAFEIMQDCDFDTYVVNFLMPGYSASPVVKAVANHPDHPLLIGFAADKISDALDQRKGLKIIPLKRLFDLDVNTETAAKDKSGGAED
jgi:hypothetical protein